MFFTADKALLGADDTVLCVCVWRVCSVYTQIMSQVCVCVCVCVCVYLDSTGGRGL